MFEHKVQSAKKILVVLILSGCSHMQEIKQFESENKWFTLAYPAIWQVDNEDDMYTFTREHDSRWAFQISSYRAVHDTIPDFNISEELQRIVLIHPTAKIISLPSRQAVYYTEHEGSDLLRIWIMGGKRCKVFCSYTSGASMPQNANFEDAKQVINSINIK